MHKRGLKSLLIEDYKTLSVFGDIGNKSTNTSELTKRNNVVLKNRTLSASRAQGEGRTSQGTLGIIRKYFMKFRRLQLSVTKKNMVKLNISISHSDKYMRFSTS